MSLLETGGAIVLAALMIAFGVVLWAGRQADGALGKEFADVHSAALVWAQRNCEAVTSTTRRTLAEAQHPSATHMGLATVREDGRKARVRNPADWALELAPVPNGPDRLTVIWTGGADSGDGRRLLARPGARLVSGEVAVPVARTRKTAGSRAGFQVLFDGDC